MIIVRELKKAAAVKSQAAGRAAKRQVKASATCNSQAVGRKLKRLKRKQNKEI
ncbi:MAG: hypothetical protein ACLTT1_05765 [[Clostridium] scindens]